MIKNYERKKLNQLLQEQELIIKRNGYCYSIQYKEKKFLQIKRDGTIIFDSLYRITTEEELVDFIKRFMNIVYTISLVYRMKNWSLQKDGNWVNNWVEADKYYKKPNVDYIIDKAIDFIKSWNIKLDKRKTISLIFEDYNIKLNNLL